MKNLEFQEYTATFLDNDEDEHESTVRAAKITEDLVYIKDSNGNNVRREVMTPVGARQVSKGDVFVETERAGVYDYMSASAWGAAGYDTETEAETEAETTEAETTPRRSRRVATSGDDS